MESYNGRLERIESARVSKPQDCGRLSLKQRIDAFRNYHATGTLPGTLIREFSEIDQEKMRSRAAIYEEMKNAEGI